MESNIKELLQECSKAKIVDMENKWNLRIESLKDTSLIKFAMSKRLDYY